MKVSEYIENVRAELVRVCKDSLDQEMTDSTLHRTLIATQQAMEEVSNLSIILTVEKSKPALKIKHV